MDPKRFEQIRKLFGAALEIEPEARAQFLRDATGSDKELYAAVVSLLSREDETPGFLETPVVIRPPPE